MKKYFFILIALIILFSLGLLVFAKFLGFKFFPLSSGFEISFVSDLPDFTLKAKNSNLLRDYLEESGFFKSNQMSLRGDKEGQLVEVKKLIIHLDDKKHLFNHYASKAGRHLYSDEEVFSKGVLNLYIGLNREIYLLGDLNKADEVFTRQILEAVYALCQRDDFYQKEISARKFFPVFKKAFKKAQDEGYFAEIVRKKQ